MENNPAIEILRNNKHAVLLSSRISLANEWRGVFLMAQGKRHNARAHSAARADKFVWLLLFHLSAIDNVVRVICAIMQVVFNQYYSQYSYAKWIVR